MSSRKKITVENDNHPAYRGRVDAGKYEAMRTALMKVLPEHPPGLTQSDMTTSVKPVLPEDLFPGG